MQPVLVHRGELVAQRLIEVFDSFFIALHALLLARVPLESACCVGGSNSMLIKAVGNLERPPLRFEQFGTSTACRERRWKAGPRLLFPRKHGSAATLERPFRVRFGRTQSEDKTSGASSRFSPDGPRDVAGWSDGSRPRRLGRKCCPSRDHGTSST